MKTVAYLINGARTYYHIVTTGSDEQVQPRPSGVYSASICKHWWLVRHLGYTSEYDLRTAGAPSVLRVSKLARKRPGCLTLGNPEGVMITVNGDRINFFSASANFIKTLFEPGERVIHLKIKEVK